MGQCRGTRPWLASSPTLEQAFVDGEEATIVPERPAAALRAERERMLESGIAAADGAVPPFRDEIITSWRRCRMVGMTPTSEDVPYRPEFERPNRLLRAAGPVIDRLAEQMGGGPASILLADSEAQIIDRRPGARALGEALDRAMVAPGFHYAEEFTGTNGIGSALEARKPFVVSGCEHYRENLQEFTCIGSPLRHPISGVVEGVLDVTCRVGEAHELMKPLVLAAVREIESRMYADASRREQMLLERFLRAGRRSGTAVLSLNEDVVMANTAASALLDVSDQASLWEWACRMLGTGDECTGEVRLAGEVVVDARATRIGDRNGTAGVLVEMRPAARAAGDRAPAGGPRARRARRAGPRGDVLPGRSVAAGRLRDAVADDDERPLLLCGEPGTGKLFVATHLHRRRGRQEPLTVLDARTSPDDPAAWFRRLTSGVDGGGTVVLRHLDQLVPELTGRVEALLEMPAGARIVATVRTRDGGSPAGRTLDHFPVSITVPPLRYRGEDIADLAPVLIGVHTARRPAPRLLPSTLRTLSGLDWPGNVRELGSVLATAVTRSLGSDIAHEHLPAEYRDSSNRSGPASLQRAERDILLEALAETHGNKLAAAGRLGIARSTLYRKMRILGIDENHLPAFRPR